MADHYAALVQFLKERTDYPVYLDLPARFEERGLPIIALAHVGPADRRPGLNSLGIDVEEIDVDFYVSPMFFKAGAGFKAAQALRLKLHRMRAPGGVRVIDVSRPVRLPDFNPEVFRLGFTVTLASPA